jgi:hypothetical protein
VKLLQNRQEILNYSILAMSSRLVTFWPKDHGAFCPTSAVPIIYSTQFRCCRIVGQLGNNEKHSGRQIACEVRLAVRNEFLSVGIARVATGKQTFHHVASPRIARRRVQIGGVERQGDVWLGGSKTGNFLLKFTTNGKFISDLGHRGSALENPNKYLCDESSESVFRPKH